MNHEGGSNCDVNERVESFLRAPYDANVTHIIENQTTITETSRQSGNSILVFRLDDSLFGLPTKDVISVIADITIQSVPFTLDTLCLGFINHRGRPVPVLNILNMLSLQQPALLNEKKKTLIIENTGLLTAIQVDAVIGTRNLKVLKDEWEVSADKTRKRAKFDDDTLLLLTSSELCQCLERGIR